jgi:hypothetical protein
MHIDCPKGESRYDSALTSLRKSSSYEMPRTALIFAIAAGLTISLSGCRNPKEVEVMNYYCERVTREQDPQSDFLAKQIFERCKKSSASKISTALNDYYKLRRDYEKAALEDRYSYSEWIKFREDQKSRLMSLSAQITALHQEKLEDISKAQEQEKESCELNSSSKLKAAENCRIKKEAFCKAEISGQDSSSNNGLRPWSTFGNESYGAYWKCMQRQKPCPAIGVRFCPLPSYDSLAIRKINSNFDKQKEELERLKSDYSYWGSGSGTRSEWILWSTGLNRQPFLDIDGLLMATILELNGNPFK